MEEFEQVIRQLIVLFEQFQPLEEEKLEAARQNNVAAVEDCMTREQAMVLKLRGLDSQREKLQEQNGWGGKTFRQILEVIAEEEELKYRKLFEELQQKILLFQSANEAALEIISLQLRQVRKAIEIKEKGEGVYNQDGGTSREEGHLTDQKV